MKINRTFHAAHRQRWRDWLTKHQADQNAVWLLFCKKHTGRKCISYDEAVEEALCFGWIDSNVQTVDADRYAQQFSPRRARSAWSASNIRRMQKLIADRSVNPVGLAKIPPALLKAGPGAVPRRPESRVPPWFREALRSHPRARANFEQLAPSYRRRYVAWLAIAKQESTRSRRLREAIHLLGRNLKLGMK